MHYHAIVNGSGKHDLEVSDKADKITLNGQAFIANIAELKPGHYHIIHQHRSYNVEVIQEHENQKIFEVNVNGFKHTVSLTDRYDDLLKSLGMESASAGKLREIKAPMPGMVLEILVSEGQPIDKDTPVVILEAMKMENVIKSPVQATVKKILARKGLPVEKNSVLVEFV